MRLGVVTGLALEARRLDASSNTKDFELLTETGAGIAARDVAEGLVARGAEALLSFGLAGALASDLATGDVMVPTEVLTEAGGLFHCHDAWSAQLFERIEGKGLVSRTGNLLGSERVLSNAEIKTELLRKTGAVAVDTESHFVAKAAHQADIPFAGVRVIVDTNQDKIPEAARRAYGADGSLRLHSLIFSLGRRPQDIGAILRLAARSRIALGSLGRIGRLGIALRPPL